MRLVKEYSPRFACQKIVWEGPRWPFNTKRKWGETRDLALLFITQERVVGLSQQNLFMPEV